MAEYGSIPARLDGSPIPALGDVQIQMTRTVTQKATTSGIKLVYGPPKYQVTFTFPTLADRIAFTLAIGAHDLKPRTHNFGYDLAGQSFACLRGIPSGLTASSNQDGDNSLQYTCLYEEFQHEGAALSQVTA